MEKQARAKVVEIVLSNIIRDSFTGKRYETGNYCVVELDVPNKLQVTMINGSAQNIPECDRVVGTEGTVHWAVVGNYHGWVWFSDKQP